MKSARFSAISGAILLASVFIIFFILNLPTFHEEVIHFESDYNGKPVTLEASYYEVSGADYAVLICPGYSCDRQKWSPMANLFVSNGISVMTFDYSGQGASDGTIGFDNAKTDAISQEIDDALAVLHENSGIEYDHIILVGHSMGGRAILRLLYDYNDPSAETRTSFKPINSAILFSPEVNYEFSAQASLFAGTSDAEDELWMNYGADTIGNTKVFLYGSTADDIVSEEDVLAIFKHIGGQNMPESGVYTGSEENENGTLITVGITSGVLHSYEMYSPEFCEFTNEALGVIDSKINNTYSPAHFVWIYVGWFLGLLGVGLFLKGVNGCQTFERIWRKINKSAEVSETITGFYDGHDHFLSLLDPKKYLLHKLLLWIPGLIIAFLLCCIFVMMPFGSPVMNLPYMICIAGYGLVMIWAYRKGHFKGTEGKLRKPVFAIRKNKITIISGIFVCFIVCFIVWYVLRSTMYRLIPFNYRWFYVLAASVLMAAGYYTAGEENDMLARSKASLKVRFLYQLIQYVPLFLLVFFYMAIGSYSGMIGQIQNMVLMYIFCVPLGRFVEKFTGSRIYGSVVTAFTFQTIMITSAALISLF